MNHIQNGGLTAVFPDCTDPESYSYEIRVLTDFEPDSDYLRVIDNLNRSLSNACHTITVTTERQTI